MSNIDLTKLVTAEQKTSAELAALRTTMMAELRARRDKLLNVMDGIQSDALAVGDSTVATSIVGIKQDLKDIPNLPSVQGATTEAAFKQAVMAAYHGVATGAPPSVVAALLGYE